MPPSKHNTRSKGKVGNKAKPSTSTTSHTSKIPVKGRPKKVIQVHESDGEGSDYDIEKDEAFLTFKSHEMAKIKQKYLSSKASCDEQYLPGRLPSTKRKIADEYREEFRREAEQEVLESRAAKLRRLLAEIDEFEAPTGRKTGKHANSDDIDATGKTDIDNDFGVLTKSTSAQTFRSLCGSEIPDSILMSIKKGEYVDFCELYNSITADVEGDPLASANNNKNSNNPDKTKQTKSLSFTAWSYCFLHFQNAYNSINKNSENLSLELMEMTTYHASIHDMWKAGYRWYAYDVTFRKKLAREKSRWHEFKFDMIQRFAGPPPPSRSSNKGSGNFAGLHVPRPHCQDYHIRKLCTRPQCRFNHTCFKCYAEDFHPAITCTRNPATLNPAAINTNAASYTAASNAATNAITHATAASASKPAATKNTQYVSLLCSPIASQSELSVIQDNVMHNHTLAQPYLQYDTSDMNTSTYNNSTSPDTSAADLSKQCNTNLTGDSGVVRDVSGGGTGP